MELLYDPAIPVLGIYLDKTTIQKDTCTSMVTAILFTIAKTRKQPKCPSTDEWIKKMWYINTMGSSCHGSVVTNLTSIHEDAGSIPDLTQWVKDLALL